MVDGERNDEHLAESATAGPQAQGEAGRNSGIDADHDKAVKVHDFAIPATAPESPCSPAPTQNASSFHSSAPADATVADPVTSPPHESTASPLSSIVTESSGPSGYSGQIGKGTPPSRVGTPVDRDAWNTFINQYTAGRLHTLEFPLDRRDSTHTIRSRKAHRRLGSDGRRVSGSSHGDINSLADPQHRRFLSAQRDRSQGGASAGSETRSAGRVSSPTAMPRLTSTTRTTPVPVPFSVSREEEEFTDQHRITSSSGAANQDPRIPNIAQHDLPVSARDKPPGEKRAADTVRAQQRGEGQTLTREHVAKLGQEQKDAEQAERERNGEDQEDADGEGSGGDPRSSGPGSLRPRQRRIRPPLNAELGARRRTHEIDSSAGSQSPEDGEQNAEQDVGQPTPQFSRTSQRPQLGSRSKRSYYSNRSADLAPEIVPFHDIPLEFGSGSSTNASVMDIEFDYATERDRVRDFFDKHGYMPAPRQPLETARRRLRVIRRLGLERPDDLHQTTLDRFTRLAVSIFGTSKAIVSVIGKDRQIFLSEIGMGAKSTAFEEAFCCHTIIGSGEACMIIPDAGKDWRFRKNPLVKEGQGIIQFYAGAPLRVGEGSKATVIGSMCIIDDKPKHDFDAKAQRLLQDLAECVVSELELLYTQRATIESAKLHQISVDFLRRSLKHRPNERAGESRRTGDIQSTTDTSSTGSQPGASKRNQGADHKQSDENVDIFDEACQEIRFALDAHAVAIVDLSQFHLFYPSYQTSTTAGGSTSASSSKRGGPSSRFKTPAGMSDRNRSSMRSGDGPSSTDDDPYQRSSNGKAPRKTYSVIDPTAASRTPQVLFVPSSNSTFGKMSKIPNIDASNTLPILGYSCGQDGFAFNFGASPAGRKIVCDFIARNVKGRTAWYSRDDSEGVAESINHLMPPGTEASLAMPVFGFDGQVAFAVVGCWTDPLFTYPAGALQFVETIAGSLLASVMKERLHQAERAQLNFAAAASHELRTPLHQINAAAALLRQALQSSLGASPPVRPSLFSENSESSERPRYIHLAVDDRKEAATHLEVIEANGVALSQILENIIDTLDIGRTTSVHRTATQGPVLGLPVAPEEMHSLSDVLESVVEDAIRNENKARRVAGEKGLEDVEILLEIMPRNRGTWTIATDPGPLARALSKIIHNSCKFTDKGYIHITVQDASRDVVLPGGYDNSIKLSQVVIDVKDTGRGMSADFLDQAILRPFAKADPFKPGTGLGLGLAQRMIEILGGKLAIKSVLNKGTLVHVEIPLHLMNADNDSDQENMADQEAFYIKRPSSPVRSDGIYLTGFTGGDAGTRRVGRALLRQLKLRFCRVVDEPRYASLVIYPEGRVSDGEIRALAGQARPDVEFICLAPAGQVLASACEPEALESHRTVSTAPGGDGGSIQITRLARPLMPRVIRRITRPMPRVDPPPERYVSDVVGGDEARQERAGSVTSLPEQDVLPSPHEASSPPGPGSVSGLSDVWSTSAESRSIDEDIPATSAPSRSHTASSSHAEITLSPPQAKRNIDHIAPARPPFASTMTDVSEVTAAGTVEAIDNGPLSLHGGLSRLSLKHTQSDPASRSTSPDASLPAPMRVLVVEDNSVNRRIVVTMLKRTACHYAEAVDGEDAVRQFLAFDPDLVLLDINMPVKDGFQASTEMREIESRRGGARRAKIIAVTALSQEHSKRKGMIECGIDEWRTKPVSLKTLKEDVEKMKL